MLHLFSSNGTPKAHITMRKLLLIGLAGCTVVMARLSLAAAPDVPNEPPDPLLDWSAWERHRDSVKHPCVTFKPADIARAKANIQRYAWAKIRNCHIVALTGAGKVE